MSLVPTPDERRRFEAAQATIADAARKADSARLSLFESREALKCAQRIGRAKHADQASIDAHAATARERKTAFTHEREAFKTFTDPRTGVPLLDDATPFLLFPLRIETRFGLSTKVETEEVVKYFDGKPTVFHLPYNPPELWVRVYPDDCLIDSFEPLPSETEIASARRYWLSMWKARGIDAQQRDAWRSFVASHGSGRAAWLEATYRPLNIQAKSKNEDLNALVLVIPTETPLTDREAEHLREFWKAVWLADGKRANIDEARNNLRTAIDSDDRMRRLIDRYKPVNLSEGPPGGLARDQVQVTVEFVEFPITATLPTAQKSWSQPARVRLLPDRLLLIAYNKDAKVLEELGNPIPWPLTVGPDPQAPEADQIRQEHGEILVSEDLKWLTDFDRAVEVGMGFRIKLSRELADQGFERLLVVGVRLSADAAEGQRLLEELLAHHRDGSSGFAVLKQGTPTNNTEDDSSGFTRTDEADRTFDERLNPGAALRSNAPWNEKFDGEWLADALGIDPSVLDTVGGSRGTDQLEAQAMNRALWPATLGYGLETMMHPLFDPDDVDQVRWFYERFVTGRGLVPAIRLGRQPYGILPTTVMSRLRWPDQTDLRDIPGADNPSGFHGTLSGMNKVLAVMSGDWADLAKKVPRVGDGGDPHQVLLDIIGLHPASVEYYQRYAESFDDLYNRMQIYGRENEFKALLTELEHETKKMGRAHLDHLGYRGTKTPDILTRYFMESANLLMGPFVDEMPLSESAVLHEVTSDHWNYIEWLREAAGTSLDTLREERGFTDNKVPKALLYLLLRHALLQAYWDSSLRLSEMGGVLDTEGVKAARRESPFIHVQQEPQSGESRWRMLYDRHAQLTGDPAVRVADYLTAAMRTHPAASRLERMIAALDVLKHLPTARLERLFAEHLDTCTYRLDAWQQGLVHYAVALSRYETEAGAPVTKRGVFLGAFGWLEHVQRGTRELRPAGLIAGLDTSFYGTSDGTSDGTSELRQQLMYDPTNGGYIHAPSLNQAVAAAVLRNGYLANATPANPEAFAVNLSTRRVRLALSFLEGIRHGQSLGALLGYQLERALHDAYATLDEMDEHIYALRREFPLAVQPAETAKAPTDPIERNVVDGLKLVEHVKTLRSRSYPFGLTTLPPSTEGIGKAIDQEVERLFDTIDAIADLKIADSVYHAVQSNYDGVAATLESSANGQLPAEPAVINTPRSGRTVTHRVALHLQSGLDEDQTPVEGIGVTPRARAEPGLNTWLGSLLPAPETVACTVSWLDPATKTIQTRPVTQKDIGLQPIDLFYAASVETDQAMSELDDRILLYAHQAFVIRPDCPVTITYRTPIAESVTFFELTPLLRCLRPLIMHSRPLRPTDAVTQGRASSSMDALVQVKPGRIIKVQTALTKLRDDLITFRDAIPSNPDDRLSTFANLMRQASSFGLSDAGWGFIFEFKRAWFDSVLVLIQKLVTRFATRLHECNTRLEAYDLAPADLMLPERLSALAAAERYVRATVTIPPPATASAYRDAVGVFRDTFMTRLGSLSAILTLVTPNIMTLRAAVDAAVNGPPTLSQLDPDKVDLTEFDKPLANFSADLLARATRLIPIIEKARLTPAAALLTQHDALADPAARARLLGEAAKKLLGDDAILIAEFKLDDDQGMALQYAYEASVAGDPLKWQRTVKHTPEPVDTWLYGVARVREKMQAWEQVVMLAGAFGAAEPNLLPLQIPWKVVDHWLGLEYPASYAPDGDRLCYTAHFAGPFDRAQWHCGLLIDEWTEVIPAKRETTGLAFHYDRPNAEAPQALLLVTPPAFIGSWQWEDLVGAVGETLDRAKSRAVEPKDIDETAYAQFLPMTAMAASLYQVSIMTNLARNNDL